MIRAVCLAVLALWGMSAVPAVADKHLITESRHPTAKERRAGRAKIEAEMEKDGFRVLPRIVGGRPAADGEYPWMVGLIEAGEPDDYAGFYCGGSLIHPYWVLTAAHCVLGSRAEDIEVLVGTNDLSNPGGGSQRIAVSEIVVSPTYNDVTMDGDFALLRLAEPANGMPIPVIDDPSQELPGVEATVTGWGDTTDGEGAYPSRLQEVELPIADLDVANASSSFAGTLTENMLPAGLAAGGKDSCQGDSGGPLIVPSPRAPGGCRRESSALARAARNRGRTGFTPASGTTAILSPATSGRTTRRGNGRTTLAAKTSTPMKMAGRTSRNGRCPMAG